MWRSFYTALITIVILAAPAEASSRQLWAAGEATPLLAWIALCEEVPAECAIDHNEPDFVALTPATQELIEAANRFVNGSIVAETDVQHWGAADRWGLPSDGRGDCEDYQLLKRKLLVEAGVPRRALLMTVVLDHLGEGHAVLTVRTDQGDLILDNLTDAVLPWHETGYRFMQRERQDRIGWARLEEKPQPTLIVSAQ